MNGYRRLLGRVLGKRLPRTSGTIRVAGPAADITIRRDGFGIPYVDAAGDEDAAFAIGFCQGQDRAFQLELLLRLARGTLAELVGRRGLPVDRLARRIGFTRGADAQLAASGPELAALVEAFARGVTAGAASGLPQRPHELALLHARPSPWEASDVIGVNRLIAFLIPSNWDAELARLKVLVDDGPGALAALDGGRGDDSLPVIGGPAPGAETVDRLAEDLELFASAAAFGAGGGSNNWALAGAKTASGRPLLACDPHLAPTLPPHWYLVHVRTDAWQLAGASYVGTPAVLVGFNGHGAWGITSGLVDNTDLFVEQLDGAQVLDGERFVPCERRVEVIRVRGAKPVSEEVLVTPNGPILSPVLDGVGRAVSLRATWLEPRPIDGFMRSFKARSFHEFRRCFERWPCVPLNLVWADASGTIGWQLAGDAPRRRRGRGLLPGPGWEPSARWEEAPVPFDELPFAVDPAGGAVATANNRPLAEGAEPYLGSDWIEGYRAARILEVLAGRDDWDLAGMLELQLDVVSLPWREIREAILAAPAAGSDGRRGRTLLEAWDGAVAADSGAATVFEFLSSELVWRAVRARAPRSAEWAAGRGFHALVPTTMYGRRRLSQLVRLLREPDVAAEIPDALAATARRLRRLLGDDETRWSWGRVRPFLLRHPLGAARPLGRVFNLGPLPGAGDASTVAQAPVTVSDPAAPPSVVASLRAAIDVGEWDENRFSLPGGQSGNPCSPHYDDLLPLWRQGSGVPIAWSPDAVRRATTVTLRLLPAWGPVQKVNQSV